MIDRRRVPGLLHGLNFLGGVVRVLDLDGGFDLEGVERAGSGRDGFLRGYNDGFRRNGGNRRGNGRSNNRWPFPF